jgi:hypothetical protein
MTTPPLTRIDRPATGSKVPLAVLRKRGADLPRGFMLDDSLAMSRDLQPTSAPVAIGGPALRLEIAETVR